ncbi:hypothetical protein ACLK19_13535 [Escherichia coli]
MVLSNFALYSAGPRRRVLSRYRNLVNGAGNASEAEITGPLTAGVVALQYSYSSQ